MKDFDYYAKIVRKAAQAVNTSGLNDKGNRDLLVAAFPIVLTAMLQDDRAKDESDG